MSASSVPSRRDRGALEGAVLEVLAAADHPQTAREVLASVDPDLAYTTVLTTLTRLHDKGLVTRHEAGRAHAFRLGDVAVRTAAQMHSLLDGTAHRAEVLRHFAAQLQPADVPVLRRSLATAGGE